MKTKNIGIFSAFTASICCVGPIALIALGLGGLGIGAAIGRYHWYFILGAILLLGIGWKSYFKEKKSCDTRGCEMKDKGITKNILIIASVIVLIFSGLNILTYASGNGNELSTQEGTQLSIPVKGMTCISCEFAVNSAVKKFPGVYEVKASAKNQKALVSYDPEKTSLDEIIEAINETGFNAEKPNI
ncbi:heavy-metal-associated domain-containing protein [PVC group bacterium]|nr:heavy-metal-associated domain-containing protein [PVC group bacterium]